MKKRLFKTSLILSTLLFISVFDGKKITALSAGNYYEFQSTAYCYGTITKTGTSPVAGRTIAVDPEVIPLGSTLEVYNEDWELVGIYQAEDTGGKVKGNIIDIYFGSGTYDECMQWGRRKVYVKIYEDAKG